MFCNAKQTILRSARYRKKNKSLSSFNPNKFAWIANQSVRILSAMRFITKKRTRNGTEVERKKETIK